ncbi:hypothetical protein [Pseudobacillus wudalianchiensis]|nr:hypothetical protein [Bacillus wudalianchiensis]
MAPIDYFAWTVSMLLGIGFVGSLATLSRRPKFFTKSEKKSSHTSE